MFETGDVVSYIGYEESVKSGFELVKNWFPDHGSVEIGIVLGGYFIPHEHQLTDKKIMLYDVRTYELGDIHMKKFYYQFELKKI